MRNRAKCKLCKSVIESLEDNAQELIACACGEIAIMGGSSHYYVEVKDKFENMLRIDDNEQEVSVKVKQSESQDTKEEAMEIKPTRDQLLEMLLEQLRVSENLPPHVRSSFVTYLDLEAALWLVYAIFKQG